MKPEISSWKSKSTPSPPPPPALIGTELARKSVHNNVKFECAAAINTLKQIISGHYCKAKFDHKLTPAVANSRIVIVVWNALC